MTWPVPGTVIYVWFLGVFRHKGIVSDRFWNGKPMVLANSWTSSGVAEISWDAFAGGREVFSEGYPSALPPWEVLYNAKSMIGEQYDIIFSNCEHFVCKCHNKEPRSAQVVGFVLLALGVAALALVSTD
ncbi:MAG TPA: lecithin retinol acyltransferase family protein [Rhizomicrobium sp.]|nr:lecithin retinol acyltransferase family protein [Rhizomicrobium sp.]